MLHKLHDSDILSSENEVAIGKWEALTVAKPKSLKPKSDVLF